MRYKIRNDPGGKKPQTNAKERVRLRYPAGTPGGPKGGFPALGSAPSNAARAAKMAAAALKLAIDAGFFVAEGVGCLGPMNH
jgi:hypothetical protein